MSDTEKTEEVVSSTKKRVKVKPAPVVSPPVAKHARRARVFRFEQWAARRGVAQHHQGGLRAYVQNVHKPRTLEEWDKCFQDY